MEGIEPQTNTKMVKYIYISIFTLTLLVGLWWYWSYDEDYYRFCKSPQKDANFKNLNIEEQFQIYVKYNCKYDSEPARIYWGFHIGEKEEAIEFLLNKLRNEQDEDVLTQTLYMLRNSVWQREIKGRNDIADLVKRTAEKISDKDERGLVEKFLSSQISSRKEGLSRVLEEIEERTKMSKAEYRAKMEKERDEKIKKEMEKLVKEIMEKAKQNQANSK